MGNLWKTEELRCVEEALPRLKECHLEEVSRRWLRTRCCQTPMSLPWWNDELRRCEESLLRLKENDLEKASRMYRAKTGVGCDDIHSKVSLGERNKGNERRNGGVPQESGAEWKVAATGLYKNVLPDSEECHG